MKIIFLIGILSIFLAGNLALQTITCKRETLEGIDGHAACQISGVRIGPNENISIKTDPENLDVTTIIRVDFSSSSIHSVPREIFTKFPNLKLFRAPEQGVQEIHPDTFRDARKLEYITLHKNTLTFLHMDTFKGLTNMKYIFLQGNQLSALPPRMFSHLSNLHDMNLSGNSCISRHFNPVTSLAAIENELRSCGIGYMIKEQLGSLEHRHDEKFKTIDRKLESLTELSNNADKRNEENAAEIKEIRKMVDKILDVMTRAK
jgi:hypothetical protein